MYAQTKTLTHANGTPVVDNTNSETAAPRGQVLMQEIWLLENLAQFNREVIAEHRIYAKGWGAFGNFTVTQNMTRDTKARHFGEVGKRTEATGATQSQHARLAGHPPMPNDTAAAGTSTVWQPDVQTLPLPW